MEHVVIDFQGLLSTGRTFVIKEIAVVSIFNDYVGHWLVKSPNSMISMCKGILQENHRLTREVHGIEWTDGASSEEEIADILHLMSHSLRTIYVKGQEKADYLERFMSSKIINLETLPSLEADELPVENKYCLMHGIRHKKQKICALNRAHQLKKLISTLNPPGETPPPPYGNHTHDEQVLTCAETILGNLRETFI